MIDDAVLVQGANMCKKMGQIVMEGRCEESTVKGSWSDNALPRHLLGVILGRYLGTKFEVDFACVNKSWLNLVKDPRYTAHTSLAISDHTLRGLQKCGTSGQEVVLNHVLNRVNVHRGNLMIQTNFLRAKSEGTANEWSMYINALLRILENVKNVRAFIFHDTSLACDANNFLIESAQQECMMGHSNSIAVEQDILYCGRGEVQGQADNLLDSSCSSAPESTLLVAALSNRLLPILSTAANVLERISLRGKIVEAAVSSQPLFPTNSKRVIMSRGNYVVLPVAMLSFFSFPKIECLHVLRAHELPDLFSFLFLHRNRLRVLAINLHDAPEDCVHESSYSCWSCLPSLGFKESGAMALSAPRCSDLHFSSLQWLNLQVTHNMDAIKFLNYLSCPNLRDLKISAVGVLQTLSSNVVAVTSFIQRNGRLLRSINFDGKLFNVVYPRDISGLQDFVLPKLRSAKVTAAVFYHYLSAATATPHLQNLIISRMLPSDSSFNVTNKDVIDKINTRTSIRDLTLPLHKGYYDKLTHVCRLKFTGWGYNDRAILVRSLPKLEYLAFSCCCVTWPYLSALLSATQNLRKLMLLGGVCGFCWPFETLNPTIIETLELVTGPHSTLLVEKLLGLGFIDTEAESCKLPRRMRLVKTNHCRAPSTPVVVDKKDSTATTTSNSSDQNVASGEWAGDDFDQLLPERWR